MSEEDVVQKKIELVKKIREKGIDPFPHLPPMYPNCYIEDCGRPGSVVFKITNPETQQEEYKVTCFQPQHPIPPGGTYVPPHQENITCPTCHGKGFIKDNEL